MGINIKKNIETIKCVESITMMEMKKQGMKLKMTQLIKKAINFLDHLTQLNSRIQLPNTMVQLPPTQVEQYLATHLWLITIEKSTSPC